MSELRPLGVSYDDVRRYLNQLELYGNEHIFGQGPVGGEPYGRRMATWPRDLSTGPGGGLSTGPGTHYRSNTPPMNVFIPILRGYGYGWAADMLARAHGRQL